MNKFSFYKSSETYKYMEMETIYETGGNKSRDVRTTENAVVESDCQNYARLCNLTIEFLNSMRVQLQLMNFFMKSVFSALTYAVSNNFVPLTLTEHIGFPDNI